MSHTHDKTKNIFPPKSYCNLKWILTFKRWVLFKHVAKTKLVSFPKLLFFFQSGLDLTTHTFYLNSLQPILKVICRWLVVSVSDSIPPVIVVQWLEVLWPLTCWTQPEAHQLRTCRFSCTLKKCVLTVECGNILPQGKTDLVQLFNLELKLILNWFCFRNLHCPHSHQMHNSKSNQHLLVFALSFQLHFLIFSFVLVNLVISIKLDWVLQQSIKMHS